MHGQLVIDLLQSIAWKLLSNTVWSPHTARAVKRLEKVQKIAIRCAAHHWDANYTNLLLQLNISTLERRRTELTLFSLQGCAFHFLFSGTRFLNLELAYHTTHTPLSDLFSFNHLHILMPIFIHLSLMPLLFWNSLPTYIIQSPNLKTFKYHISNLPDL